MPDIAESFATGGWEFTPEVAHVFPEHVRASVPFYDQIQQLVVEVADWALPPGGVFADLGAATGETVQELLNRHPDRKITAHLYDSESAMLDRAKAELNATPGREVYYHHQRVQEPLQHKGADLTVALFTLQFLTLQDRLTTLSLAREAAGESGMLLVAEKIRPTDSRWAEIANERSHDWKAAHGITDTAIRAKSRALRGILIPHPLDTLRELVTSSGWRHPEVLFTWHSWTVLGAFVI